MSSPNTNIDKQVKRHRGPLYGISLALTFAAVLFLVFLGWTSYNGNDPTDDEPVATVNSTD